MKLAIMQVSTITQILQQLLKTYKIGVFLAPVFKFNWCVIFWNNHILPPVQYIIGENLNVLVWNLFFEPQWDKHTPEIRQTLRKIESV